MSRIQKPTNDRCLTVSNLGHRTFSCGAPTSGKRQLCAKDRTNSVVPTESLSPDARWRVGVSRAMAEGGEGAPAVVETWSWDWVGQGEVPPAMDWIGWGSNPTTFSSLLSSPRGHMPLGSSSSWPSLWLRRASRLI